MRAKQIVLSRLLPKTGQSTGYRLYDDGVLQKGWWKGLSLADNYDRFIQKTINGDVVVIDRASGLMWAADANAIGCNNNNLITWAGAVDYAEALTFAGFSDWYLPNILELASICDAELNSPCIKEPPFINTRSDIYWSSTTRSDDTTKAVRVHFVYSVSCYASAKGSGYYMRAVRSL